MRCEGVTCFRAVALYRVVRRLDVAVVLLSLVGRAIKLLRHYMVGLIDPVDPK